jgi:hypothetical protein
MEEEYLLQGEFMNTDIDNIESVEPLDVKQIDVELVNN